MDELSSLVDLLRGDGWVPLTETDTWPYYDIEYGAVDERVRCVYSTETALWSYSHLNDKVRDGINNYYKSLDKAGKKAFDQIMKGGGGSRLNYKELSDNLSPEMTLPLDNNVPWVPLANKKVINLDTKEVIDRDSQHRFSYFINATWNPDANRTEMMNFLTLCIEREDLDLLRKTMIQLLGGYLGDYGICFSGKNSLIFVSFLEVLFKFASVSKRNAENRSAVHRNNPRRGRVSFVGFGTYREVPACEIVYNTKSQEQIPSSGILIRTTDIVGTIEPSDNNLSAFLNWCMS